MLWRHFHNPFFPLFGSIFPSIWVPPVNASDPRFLPRNSWQWLFYPFFWLNDQSFIVSEEKLKDPRFALAYLALAVRSCPIFWRGTDRPSRMVLGLWGFFVVSYCLWLIGFSILRYAIALEVLSGILIWTALRPLFPGKSVLALGVICLGCYAYTKPMGWGRIRFTEALVEAPIPVVPPGSVVFMQGRPLGFVVPYLYRTGTAFISLDGPWPDSAVFSMVQKRVANPQNIFLLTDLVQSQAMAASINAQLGGFDLIYHEASCMPVRSAVQRTIRICSVDRRT
jgi:hypothetical protein